ncbi:cysteine desulfurase [Facklamia sp. DSM 111018]|uniref:Cysteine desulfurase n=1 Tax=Facklamia lactis TaxID=2749967 RepID=A0ABS0LNC9_9LACT|nr:cysteine desulfurase [Facklamia lactis]MBG9985627.1 cysteine desulfurase [Facklamia lactis]
MAFADQATLRGFNRTFKIHPECKPYTLRDNGFQETRGGNYLYKRELDSTHRTGLVLKVTVNHNLQGIKISTVNNNGLQGVNVFNLANNEMVIEKINFIFDGFVDRQVLVEV